MPCQRANTRTCMHGHTPGSQLCGQGGHDVLHEVGRVREGFAIDDERRHHAAWVVLDIPAWVNVHHSGCVGPSVHAKTMNGLCQTLRLTLNARGRILGRGGTRVAPHECAHGATTTVHRPVAAYARRARLACSCRRAHEHHAKTELPRSDMHRCEQQGAARVRRGCGEGAARVRRVCQLV